MNSPNVVSSLITPFVSQTCSTVIGRSPASWNSWIPCASSPAAKTIRRIPVTVKNWRRLSRREPR